MSDKKDHSEGLEMTPAEVNVYTAGLVDSNGEGLAGLELEIFDRCQVLAQKRARDEQELQTWVQQAERLRREIQVADHQIVVLSEVLVSVENKRRTSVALADEALGDVEDTASDGSLDGKPGEETDTVATAALEEALKADKERKLTEAVEALEQTMGEGDLKPDGPLNKEIHEGRV